MPTYSTIRKAAAPITGGMICPLTDEATSTAPAFSEREANPLHQRNGECAGGHNVGDRRARDQAGCGRADNRGFCRATAQVSKRAKGHLDKVVARPGLIQQGAEQHEQEDEFRGHAKCDTEHTLGGDPHMAHGLLAGWRLSSG